MKGIQREVLTHKLKGISYIWWGFFLFQLVQIQIFHYTNIFKSDYPYATTMGIEN